MLLADQVVLITGAAGNLGSAIARAASVQGARLVLADVRRDPLIALADELGGATLIVDGADVRTVEGCERIVTEAEGRFGGIDALANTVGTFKVRDVHGQASEDFDFLMGLNVLSALRLSEAVLPGMRARRHGRLVHTAAGAGWKSFAGASIYSASKAAVMRISESISEENKAHGITSNCVAPGTIDTPQNRAAMPDADFSLWVSPDEIAAVFAFLMSPNAGAITGATIPVTGKG